MRLIDADELRKQAIKELHITNSLKDVTDLIDSAPTIEPSVSTNSDDLIIKNGKGIQDGLYNIKDGEIFKYKAKGGTVRAYKLVESVSAEPNKSRPYGDCAKCIHTYGTLGCCVTVNNEWVYDCDNGMAQYETTKAEPSGDLVNRKTLIGAIEKCGEEKIYPQALIETIKALPIAEPKWIPVSEMLPKVEEQVLCCDSQLRVFTSALTEIASNGMTFFGKHCKVIAWMPLPEPYREDGEE